MSVSPVRPSSVRAEPPTPEKKLQLPVRPASAETAKIPGDEINQHTEPSYRAFIPGA